MFNNPSFKGMVKITEIKVVLLSSTPLLVVYFQLESKKWMTAYMYVFIYLDASAKVTSTNFVKQQK